MAMVNYNVLFIFVCCFSCLCGKFIFIAFIMQQPQHSKQLQHPKQPQQDFHSTSSENSTTWLPGSLLLSSTRINKHFCQSTKLTHFYDLTRNHTQISLAKIYSFETVCIINRIHYVLCLF